MAWKQPRMGKLQLLGLLGQRRDTRTTAYCASMEEQESNGSMLCDLKTPSRSSRVLWQLIRAATSSCDQHDFETQSIPSNMNVHLLLPLLSVTAAAPHIHCHSKKSCILTAFCLPPTTPHNRLEPPPLSPQSSSDQHPNGGLQVGTNPRTLGRCRRRRRHALHVERSDLQEGRAAQASCCKCFRSSAELLLSFSLRASI